MTRCHHLRSASLMIVCLTGIAPVMARAPEMTSSMSKGATSAPHAANYVDVRVFDVTKAIPPPPEAGSLADMADLESLLEVQAARSAVDCDWAGLIIKGDVFSSSDLIGSWFATKENLPATAELFNKVSKDVSTVTDHARDLFKRVRPYVASTEVSPCVTKPNGYSYPSGYATEVYVRALILAELFPDKRTALITQAHRRAWARVLGGVHYPSDDIGGKLLADALLAEFRKSPAFMEALDKAKAEVRTAALAHE